MYTKEHTWFVEASVGGVILFLTEKNDFTQDAAKARSFPTKAVAELEYEESTHYGTTPVILSNLKTRSLLKRRYPFHNFRAVRLDIREEVHHVPFAPRINHVRRNHWFSIPGLFRLVSRVCSKRT